MNHVFRIVWSKALGTWVVASESTAQRGKTGGDTRRCKAVLAGVGIAATLAICCWTPPASAQIWTGATSNDWTVASNWHTGTLPTGLATIRTATARSPVIGAAGPVNVTIGQLSLGTLGGSTTTLTVQNGSTLTWTVNTLMASGPGANATLTVTGPGSALSNLIDFTLGYGLNSTGTLNIADGATARTGRLHFGGSLGGSGSGALNITGGGALTTLGDSDMNRRNGSSIANVSGAGSRWTLTGSLYLGNGVTSGTSGSSVVNVENGGAVSAAGAITIGGSQLSLSGAGTATVTGAGSQLNSGTLHIGQWGTGTLTVSNGAVATANTVTLGESTPGRGTLNLLGGGTLATQSLTGGIGELRQANFDGGTLRATASNTAFITGFSGTELNIGAGGLNFDTAGLDVTAASPFSGAGALTKSGLGTAVLTGDNSYTGGTTISAGTLQLGNGGSSGSITGNVTNNGTLAFNRSDVYTPDGQISGSGTVRQIGTGTTILTSSNTYSGGTAIDGGTLQIGNGGSSGSITGDVANSGTLAFNRSDRLDFGGAISGAGAIRQIGTGLTNLTDNSAAFTGTTTVEAGTLAVNGVLGGSANVLAGGRLQGTGTVGNTTVAGTVAPGNSIGTLTVNGSYTQAAGSTYEVEFDAASTASDRIHASGSASVASGARLNVVRTNGANPVIGNRYTVLTADGGVTGIYSLQGDIQTAFVQLVDSYDANNVYLSAQQVRSFTDAATTPNQVAVSTALESLPEDNRMVNAVAFLPSDFAARDAFNQLSVDIHASNKTALLEDSRFVREAAIDRLRTATCAPGSAPAVPKQEREGCTHTDKEARTAWGQVFGSWGHIDGDGNAAKLKRDIGGFLVGADTGVGAGWRVGGLGGYSRASADTDAHNSSAKTDSYHLGLYGSTQWGATALRLGASQSWNKTETSRSVAFAGFADSVSAEYDSTTSQLFGEVGHRIEAGTVALEPFAGLAHVRVKSDAFFERGGLAALYGDGGSVDATFSTLGVRASTQVGERTRVRGLLGWRHAFGDTTPTSTHAFGGSLPFTLAGVPLAKNVAVLEAGVETQLRPNLSLGASYSGQFGDGLQDHGFKVNLNWTF